MKQTNNALTFLMAQYRAIFKNAYFKGLSAALLVTAGLTVGQGAVATDYKIDTLTSGTVNVDSGDILHVTSTSDASWDANVTINNGVSGDVGDYNYIVSTTAAATLSGSGSLTVKSGTGLLIAANAASADLTIGIESVTAEEGADIVLDNKAAGASDVLVSAKNINVNSTITLKVSDNTKKVTLGGEATSTPVTDSITTLGKNGVIKFSGADATKADKAVFAGQLAGNGTLDFTEGSGTISGSTVNGGAAVTIKATNGNTGDLNLAAATDVFKLAGGTIELGNDTTSGTLQITKGILEVDEETTFEVSQNGKILFNSSTADDEAVLAGTLAGNVGTLEFAATGSGSLITANTIADGIDVNIRAVATSTSGAKATLDLSKNAEDQRIFKINKGEINLTGDTSNNKSSSFTVKEGTTLSLGDGVTFAGNASGALTISGASATLETSVAQLNKAAQNFSVTVSGDATNKIDAILKLTDENVDLDKITFAGTAAAGTVGIVSGSIVGNNVSIGNDIGTTVGSVEAQTLTFKAPSNTTKAPKSGKYNVSEFNVANSLTFASKDITVANGVSLGEEGAQEVNASEEFRALGSNRIPEHIELLLAQTGTISAANTGDGTFTGTGELNIVNGTWTDDNANLTFTAGGTLQVGALAKDKEGHDIETAASLVFGSDAKLILDAGGQVNVGATYSATNKVLQANLDLTNAQVELKSGATANAFNVNQNGNLTVSNTLAQDLLNVANNTSTTINSGGNVVINGNVTALPTDFLGTTATAGKIGFNGTTTAGQEAALTINGDLTLDFNNNTATTDELGIGAGYLTVNNLILKGNNVGNEQPTETKFGAGNITVLGEMTTDVVKQDNNMTLNGTHITYGSAESTGGDIASNLALNIGATSSGAEVNILAGSWNAKDITINNGTLNVGLTADDAAATQVNANQSSLKVLGTSSKANISKNAEVRFEGFEVSGGRVDIEGKLTVAGKYTEKVFDEKGKLVTPASWGVNLNGGRIAVHGNNANLTIGKEALSSLQTESAGDEGSSIKLKLNNAGTETAPNYQVVYQFAGDVPTDTKKLAAGGDAIFNKNIAVFNNGTLTLDFDSNVVFDDDSLRALRKGLLITSTNEGTDSDGNALKSGYINLGSAKITDIDDKIVDGTISKDVLNNYKDIANLKDMVNDALSSAVLVNVANGDEVSNVNVGAVRVNGSGLDVYFGDATLNNASANDGYFVSNVNGATDTMRIHINRGANFGLIDGGSIGEVSLAAGYANDNTTLTVKSDSGVTTFASLDARDNTTVNIAGDTEIKKTTTLDNLQVDKALTVNGDTVVRGNLTSTVNADKKLVETDGTITTNALSVAGTANYAGNITTTKDATFAGDANLLGAVDVAGDLSINGNLSSLAGLGLDPTDPANYVKADTIKAKNLNVSGDSSYTGDMDITETASFNALTALVDDDGNYIQSGTLKAKVLNVAGDSSYIGNMEISDEANFSSIGLVGNNKFGDVIANSIGFYSLPDDDEGVTKYKSEVKNLTIREGGAGLEVEGATLSAGVIKFAGDNGATTAKLYVGENLYTNDQGKEVMGNTGYLMADSINLNGAALVVDPDFSKAASIATVNRFGAAATDNTAGTLKGDVLALQNGIVAIGVERTVGEGAEAQDGIAQVQALFNNNNYKYFADNGALNYNTTTGEGVGSIVYVAKSLTVADGSHLVADATKSRRNYDNGGTSALSNLGDAVVSNEVYLGKGGVLAINVGAAKDAPANKGIIHFNTPEATIYNNGGKIVLMGKNLLDGPITLMSDNGEGEGEYAVEVVAADGTEPLKITSLSGLLSADIDVKAGDKIGQVTLKISDDDDDVTEVRQVASDPVIQSLKDYGAYVLAGNPNDNEFLYDALTNGGDDAKDVEKVARAGAYAGAAQTALVAGATTYDAVSGRMGVGANGANITVADNTQGAALWLAPVYKNNDSDGFGAQGVEYGVDLDLYGVALGADYSLANGVRVGAAFNVGSGDADGNGAGDGVKNDFDYYGFAIYGGYSYGPWSVVADLSYTNVDNDVEVNSSGGRKGNTSFDSSNLSLGVTAQYQAILDGDVSVTPHAGLRYTKIDFDDYTLKDEDGYDVTKYTADDMSVLSIPVGVTVSKEFVNGTWTVKPSFDLTLTCNFGDDELEGTTNWADAGGLATKTATEVLDNFTYGATVGVAAKSGNFSLGFGLNYTGSSNTDEFGVNANARFVF